MDLRLPPSISAATLYWDIYFSYDTSSQSKQTTSSGAQLRTEKKLRTCFGPSTMKIVCESPTCCLCFFFFSSRSFNLIGSSLSTLTRISKYYGTPLTLATTADFTKLGCKFQGRHLHLLFYFWGIVYSGRVSQLDKLISHLYPSVLLVIKQTI